MTENFVPGKVDISIDDDRWDADKVCITIRVALDTRFRSSNSTRVPKHVIPDLIQKLQEWEERNS